MYMYVSPWLTESDVSLDGTRMRSHTSLDRRTTQSHRVERRTSKRVPVRAHDKSAVIHGSKPCENDNARDREIDLSM